MVKIIAIILICLYAGISEAQVSQGTVFSKALDGNGNKITSEVVGADRGLHMVCIFGCAGAGGTTDANIIQLLGVAPSATNPFPQRLSTGTAFYDARDRNWTLSSGTDSVAVTNAGLTNLDVALSTRLADSTFTGRFVAAYVDADAIANQTTTAMHGHMYGYNGATWDRLRSSIVNGLLVDVSRVTGNVTVVQGTIANLKATVTGNGAVVSESIAIRCVDLAGAAFESCAGGAAGGSTFGAAFPATGTASGYSDGTNMQAARVFDLDTGAGSQYGLGVNLRFSASGGSVEAGTASNPVRVDPTGSTIQPVSGTVTANAGTNLNTSALALDATITNRFPAGSTPADNESNAVTISRLGAFSYIFDGAAWDRWTGAVSQSGTWNINNISGTVSLPTGAATEATLATRLADSTFTGRFTAAALDADAIANETSTAIRGKCYLYNGTTWDRCRGAIATGLLVNISNATLAVTQSGTWNIGTLTSITNTVTVAGNKTNNNAAPGATNVGVLPCVATAAAPTHTEGNQVGCSTNLGGAQRVIEQNFISTANNDGACPSGAVNFTVAASNASRTWLAIWASPGNTDDVYVKLGATATSSDARIAPGQAINFTSGRIYTGQIDAIPVSGTQAVCLMELN